MTLFFNFIKNSTTYWSENRYGNSSLSFFLKIIETESFSWEKFGVIFQPNSHQMRYITILNLKIGLKTKMRTKYPCENRSTLVHTFTPSTRFFFFWVVPTHSLMTLSIVDKWYVKPEAVGFTRKP
jgi:hypothetical protein